MQKNIQEIVLCKLEDWLEAEKTKNAANVVIYGEPCEKLAELQQQGYCILAELKHLQGLSEAETAEALGREESVRKFTNVCINALELSQGYLRRILCRTAGVPVLIAETERLIIRESIPEDAEAFNELYQDADCRKYLGPLPVENGNAVLCKASGTEIEKYRSYIKEYINSQYAFYEYGMWTVAEKESGSVVGRMGLEQQEGVISLGYALLPEFRRKGYTVEACLAILAYSKECDYAERVAIRFDRENEKSRKVAERLQAVEGNTIQLVELPG